MMVITTSRILRDREQWDNDCADLLLKDMNPAVRYHFDPAQMRQTLDPVAQDA